MILATEPSGDFDQLSAESFAEPALRGRILIVDDQPDNLLSAEAVLESLGREIVTSKSGREALRHLLEKDFAVILLDVMMPEIDGFETAALIRSRERSRYTPIIFVTALGRSDEHMFQGYEAGAVDYLDKPIVPQVLRSKVSVFLDLYEKSILVERKNRLLEAAMRRQMEAEQEVQKLNTYLEQRLAEVSALNCELESFSYSVSHDLRAPLSRISGFARALLEFHADDLNEEGKAYLNRICSGAEKATQLVDDLLKLSRLTRAELSREPVDLAEMAQTIAGELRSREPGRHIQFRTAPRAPAYADPNLVRAALVNLLENAWKFTGRTEAGVVEFGVTTADGLPAYYVRDNGAGFDMAAAGKLFTPFQRLHLSSQFEGTGVGLATVDRIIRRHGGRVWAEAAVGRGATFFFTLPVTSAI